MSRNWKNRTLTFHATRGTFLSRVSRGLAAMARLLDAHCPMMRQKASEGSQAWCIRKNSERCQILDFLTLV